jgi:hypothetical protein
MSSTGITLCQVYGTYVVPQNYFTTPAVNGVFILGQFWYDFSRITKNNLNMYLSMESRGFFPSSFWEVGIYFLPDGVIDPHQLFGGAFGGSPPLNPNIDVVTTHLATGVGGNTSGIVTIPNPKIKRQVLVASLSETGEATSSASMRSMNLKIVGA